MRKKSRFLLETTTTKNNFSFLGKIWRIYFVRFRPLCLSVTKTLDLTSNIQTNQETDIST